MKKQIFFALSMMLINNANAVDSDGLGVSLAGDILGSFGKSTQNTLQPRSAEISFYAAVDPNFEATLTAAAHYEAGETFFELHELFLKNSSFLPRTQIKLGKYFLGIGRLNQMHQHEWPFSKAPLSQETFFDSEALGDTGIEITHLLPFESYWDITLGLSNGWTYGHSHTEGSKPDFPTHYIRIMNFINFVNNDGGFQWGANYLGRKDHKSDWMKLYGLDFVLKWKNGRFLDWQLQGESWLQQLITSNATSNTWSSYVYLEKGINLNWLSGIRLDSLTLLNQKNALGQKETQSKYSVTPQVGWKSSEFSKIVASYEWLKNIQPLKTTNEHNFYLQFTFILGSHPAHNF